MCGSVSGPSGGPPRSRPLNRAVRKPFRSYTGTTRRGCVINATAETNVDAKRGAGRMTYRPASYGVMVGDVVRCLIEAIKDGEAVIIKQQLPQHARTHPWGAWLLLVTMHLGMLLASWHSPSSSPWAERILSLELTPVYKGSSPSLPCVANCAPVSPTSGEKRMEVEFPPIPVSVDCKSVRPTAHRVTIVLVTVRSLNKPVPVKGIAKKGQVSVASFTCTAYKGSSDLYIDSNVQLAIAAGKLVSRSSKCRTPTPRGMGRLASLPRSLLLVPPTHTLAINLFTPGCSSPPPGSALTLSCPTMGSTSAPTRCKLDYQRSQ